MQIDNQKNIFFKMGMGSEMNPEMFYLYYIYGVISSNGWFKQSNSYIRKTLNIGRDRIRKLNKLLEAKNLIEISECGGVSNTVYIKEGAKRMISDDIEAGWIPIYYNILKEGLTARETVLLCWVISEENNGRDFEVTKREISNKLDLMDIYGVRWIEKSLIDKNYVEKFDILGGNKRVLKTTKKTKKLINAETH